MLVAQGLDPTDLPKLSRLTSNLASMEGLPYGRIDASADGVIRMIHMDAQSAKLLLCLQDFKLASASPVLEFDDQWFQVLA
jgi:hypothetical protein